MQSDVLSHLYDGDSGTLADRVFKDLQQRIITGELRPNQRLVESDIANLLGTSRTPVREALTRLRSTGYVSEFGKGGLIVKEATSEHVQNLYEIREALETEAIKLACDRATEEEINTAEEYYHLCVETIHNRDYDEYFKIHRDFHEAIYIGCHNDQLWQLVRTYRYLYFDRRFTRAHSYRDWQIFGIQQHSRILEALRARNARSAEKAVRRHLRTSLKVALQLL